MKTISILHIISSLLLFSCKTVSNEDKIVIDRLFFKLEDSLIKNIERNIIPSFSVAVSVKGDLIWQKSYGWADKENKIEAKPSTPYALASLSKSITSTALMILVEKGLVNFDEPAEKYLGNSKLHFYKGKPEQLLVSHLTNMMGGIPHQFEYYYKNEHKHLPSIEEQISHYGIIVYPPGTTYTYSNFSPAIVEQIINVVSKQDLSRFIGENLFKPLMMNHSAVRKGKFNRSVVAKGYDSKGNLLADAIFYPVAGAGYYSSAADLLRFGRLHLKEKGTDQNYILNDKSIETLHSSNEIPGFNKFYSNGWGVLNLDSGLRSLITDGAIDGTASTLLLLPDKDIAIVCLTNATVGNDFTDQYAFGIADALCPGYLVKVGKFFDTNAQAFSDKPFVVSDSVEGSWKGKIKTPLDSVSIEMTFDKNGRIFLHLDNQFESLLNDVTINDGVIHGQSFGSIDLPETYGYPHYLDFQFKIESGELFGSVSAQSFNLKRPYFLLPAFIHLKRII